MTIGKHFKRHRITSFLHHLGSCLRVQGISLTASGKVKRASYPFCPFESIAVEDRELLAGHFADLYSCTNAPLSGTVVVGVLTYFHLFDNFRFGRI